MSDFDALERRVNACTRCTLSQKRTNAVPGEGSRSADIVFVGEGPGFHEDQQGRPFVGPAGRLLDELLASVGLDRKDVYITNMIKCRPPNNRDPLPGEIEACKPYLDEQIEMIAPKVVVALGRYSFSKFFPDEPIGKARGKPRRWNGLIVYPMYHPAAALRNFQSLLPLLEKGLPSSRPQEADQSEQLSLL
jgi:DNA polymerase